MTAAKHPEYQYHLTLIRQKTFGCLSSLKEKRSSEPVARS